MKARITDRALASLAAGETLWDTEVRGFGARKRRADGAITFVLKYRSPIEMDQADATRGKQRMLTLGRRGRGDLGIDDARIEATGIRLELRAGRDPAVARETASTGITVSSLCADYLASINAGEVLTRGRVKRASTVATDRSRINAHIIPLFGAMLVAAVTTADVQRASFAIAAGKTAAQTAGRGAHATGGRGAATRTIGLLGGIFAYAIKKGLRSDNPVRGVERYADGRRERRLADGEYRQLANTMGPTDGFPIWPAAVAASRMLLLTGWRLGEVLNLKWSDIDLARRTATLPETKTGRSMRPLSHVVVTLIRAQPVSGDLVFPAARGTGPMTGFRKSWLRLIARANLPSDITPHVLRHSYASLAGDLGLSEPTIGALIGHRSATITGRYTHLADAPLLAAADRVATALMALMGEAEMHGSVVSLRA